MIIINRFDNNNGKLNNIISCPLQNQSNQFKSIMELLKMGIKLQLLKGMVFGTTVMIIKLRKLI